MLARSDLLIRTSGEMRVSNFCLQIAYAEIFVNRNALAGFQSSAIA